LHLSLIFSGSVGRAAAAQGGAHGIPISRPEPTIPEASWLVPFACRGALLRGQRGKLPLGFVSYGVVDGNLKEREARRAWSGWSLREATRRERGASLRWLCWFWLVALPLATGQGDKANLGLGRAAAVRFPYSLVEIGRSLSPWTQQAWRIEARVRGSAWIWRAETAPWRQGTGR
jgi:hypothetical protein